MGLATMDRPIDDSHADGLVRIGNVDHGRFSRLDDRLAIAEPLRSRSAAVLPRPLAGPTRPRLAGSVGIAGPLDLMGFIQV